MEVSVKLHPRPLYPREGTPYRYKTRLFGAPKLAFGNDKISDRDSNFGPSRPLTCHYIDWANRSPLLRQWSVICSELLCVPVEVDPSQPQSKGAMSLWHREIPRRKANRFWGLHIFIPPTSFWQQGGSDCATRFHFAFRALCHASLQFCSLHISPYHFSSRRASQYLTVTCLSEQRTLSRASRFFLASRTLLCIT